MRNNPINLKDPEGLSHDRNTCNNFSVRMSIHPGGKRGVTMMDMDFHLAKIKWGCCKEVKFVQIAKSGLYGNWHIDDSKEQPWYHRDYSWNKKLHEANLGDEPGCKPGLEGAICRRLPRFTQTFETCAICTKGTEKNRNYGCIKWGHIIRFGNVVKIWPGERVRGIKPSRPTETFNKLTNYKFQYIE